MRITYSRILTSFGLGVIMLVMALAPIGLPPPTSVDASHDDPATSHLLPGDDAKAGRIVRNVILGDGIPVCSDDYPKSTKFAATRWNTFFGRTMSGKQVFQLKPDGSAYGAEEPECASMRRHSSLGIGSVLVKQTEHNLDCLVPVGGCIHLTTNGNPPNEAWDTFTGQLVIYVWKHYDEVENPLTMQVSTVLTRLIDGERPVTRTVAHELGHVFGLGDYSALSCDGTPSIMAQLPSEDGTGADCYSTVPRSRDREDFRASYVPEDPTIRRQASISPAANTAVVSWDAIRVHVEKEFEIQRKTAQNTWEAVSTRGALPIVAVPTQPAAATLTAQTPGLQTYRVVAKTAAPLQGGHVAASDEIEITVRAAAPPTVLCTVVGSPGILCTLSPPTTLSVSNVTDNSATLQWTNVPAATGYKVRLDEEANSTKTLGDANAYAFTGLTAGTAHLLEVASTISTGDSNFASLMMLVPPGLHTPVPGVTSITISWTGVSLATAYDVRVGADDETIEKADGESAARSHQFTGLTASTSYTLYVRATNAQGPSAWAKTTADTSARPARPQSQFSQSEVVLRSWEATEEEGDGIIACWLQRYLYEVYVIRSVTTTYSWNGSSWVASTSVVTSPEITRKTAIGNLLPIRCLGARAHSTSPFLIGGDYVFTWGGTSVSFTVPADATIELDWRVLASGVRAAVLTDSGKGEVLVYPGAQAARGARSSDGETNTRSADLQSIETSILEAQSATGTATASESSMCADVSSSDGSAAAIALDAGRCASVPAGGAMRITVGGNVLTLTLTADRYWMVARLGAAGGDESERVGLFDAASASWLLLDPATGAEVARRIPDDAEAGIGALFDAIVTSATSS